MIVNVATIIDYYLVRQSLVQSTTDLTEDTAEAISNINQFYHQVTVINDDQLTSFKSDEASFFYPIQLGNLSINNSSELTNDKQIIFSSDNTDLQLATYSLISHNLVFYVKENDKHNLYLLTPNKEKVWLASYDVRVNNNDEVEESAWQINVSSPVFSPQGNLLIITFGGYEWSNVVIYRLVKDRDIWDPKITTGDSWTSYDSKTASYPNIYITDNEKYAVITSDINRLSGGGTPGIYAGLLFSTSEEGAAFYQSSYIYQVYETADPIFAHSMCSDGKSQYCDANGERADDSIQFSNINLSEDGILSFKVHNILVNAPDQDFTYDINTHYLHPTK